MNAALSEASSGDLLSAEEAELVELLTAILDSQFEGSQVARIHPDDLRPCPQHPGQFVPVMDLNQWLLVTLTAGVGGSMLSVGSAAGVALMGQARGTYTFFGHLKWAPAIMLGYALSIWVHLLINARFVGVPVN